MIDPKIKSDLDIEILEMYRNAIFGEKTKNPFVEILLKDLKDYIDGEISKKRQDGQDLEDIKKLLEQRGEL